MTCEVKEFAKVLAFKTVQTYFGLSHDESWFDYVKYSISPTGELIALGMGEKFVFLSQSSESNEGTMSYEIIWSAELEDPNQIITSILCIPMYGRNVSSGPEWTCVALGLNSGMIVFYSSDGTKVFSQIYHENYVLQLKCYSPPRYSKADSLLYIVYSDCICIIKGIDIYMLLTNLRHNLNQMLNRNYYPHSNTTLKTPDLIHYQKFKFKIDNENVINDALLSGTQHSRTLDHILQQSINFGLYAKVSNIPVQGSSVIAVGSNPYLSFHCAEEGYKTISFGDVLGFAYKNILGNIFRQPSEQQKDISSPSKESLMRTRSHFYDKNRIGSKLAISPDGKLAAIVDSLSRVVLVDIKRGVTLRIWKGYPNAQCAFLPVKEKTLKGIQSAKRTTLFLILYLPRHQCLEVWSLQNGPKVVAFSIGKNAHLSYNTHGMLGVPADTKVKASLNTCLYIDPIECSIKEIQIPFHYALSAGNSITSRDIHVLTRLKKLLRSSDLFANLTDISKLAEEFETIEVRQQCLEILKKNKRLQPEIFQTIIVAFINTLLDTENLNSQNFLNTLKNYKCLTDFYIAIRLPKKGELNEFLELNDCDLVTISHLVVLLSDKESNSSGPIREIVSKTAKVTFNEEYNTGVSFVDYLSIFDVHQKEFPFLNRAKSHSFSQVSSNLFNEFFESGLCMDQFKQEAEQANLPYFDLLILVFYYWIEKPFTYANCDEVISDMSRLAAVVRAVCELAGDYVNSYEYNAISPWWQQVREILLECPKSLALLVAIVCKTIASDLRNKIRGENSCDEDGQTEDIDLWERISHDEAQWGLLIGKLDDISVLGAILERPIISVDPVMPDFPYKLPDCSLKLIVTSGKGIVSCLTAKWLLNSKIHPSKLMDTMDNKQSEEMLTKEAIESPEKEKKTSEVNIEETYIVDLKDPVVEKLSLLRKHFPFSLASGLLLTDMTWQYILHWCKNIQNLEYFGAAIKCLAEIKISDYALKHGICCMLWNGTLKHPLQSTAKLVQKVGRLPNNKMCQQDLQMSNSNLPDFLDMSLDFIKHFSSSLNHTGKVLKFEESLNEGEIPLQLIALQQNPAIQVLLELQYQVCSVLYFLTYFQIKFHKPLTTLFDAMANKAFLVDINKEPLFSLPAADPVLQKAREDFLCKVITASMDLIRMDLEQLYVEEYLHYMKKILALSDSWELNKAQIKRWQIVELYAHCYDEHAEPLLNDLTGDKELPRLLLEIAGHRMNLFTNNSQKAYLQIATVGPLLINFLDEIKENSSMQINTTDPGDINIEALTKIVAHAVNMFTKKSRYLHIGGQLYDACCILKDKSNIN